jgi:lactoylglutathione lyase
MKLNHLNLPTTDPIETQAFLLKYFGLSQSGKPSDRISFVTDENGLVLSLTHPELGGETGVKYPANFHIGFIQANETAVNELNRRLKEDGYDVPPPARQHGAWTFYFEAPGGIIIEVMA